MLDDVLFGWTTTSAPKTEQILQEIEKTLTNLSGDSLVQFNQPKYFKFVNREDEVVSVISKFVFTLWLQKTTPNVWKGKFTLFTDQHFGSGKSYFGSHLIKKSKEPVFKF